jgi:hypothetical protein
MKWIYALRSYLFYRALRTVQPAKAQHLLLNIKEVNSIGILYESTGSADDQAVAAFRNAMLQQGKTVEVLCLVNDAKVLSKENAAIFHRRDIGFNLVPAGGAVAAFTNKPFDLLLAAFTEENLPLEYISYSAKATCRVGVFQLNKTGAFELMVNVGAKKELPYLFEQSVHFLSKINHD